MYVILVYDINLEDKEGQRVLRNVFKSRSQRWLEKKFIGKVEDDKTSNFL